jgi:hypothetical protein
MIIVSITKDKQTLVVNTVKYGALKKHNLNEMYLKWSCPRVWQVHGTKVISPYIHKNIHEKMISFVLLSPYVSTKGTKNR